VLVIHGLEAIVLGVAAIGHGLASHRWSTRYMSRTGRELHPLLD
jgi:hypothetical protein